MPTRFIPSQAPSAARRSWTVRRSRRAGVLLAVIAAMHVLSFGVLILLVEPGHYRVGGSVLGIGLGLTAYTYGLRHAFDADHIAAIDNTTRKLRDDGHRCTSVGFWFALGHSTTVSVMALLVAAGSHLVRTLTSEKSTTSHVLGLVGTAVSGGFLYLIALLNLAALLGIVRVFRAMRHGELDEADLQAHLDSRGVMGRLVSRMRQTVTRPWQMFVVGLLFGLGFDTATEVALLVMAGSGAASGLPWYAVMVLPALFACGMSLLDALDGMIMSAAYDWAFLHPMRKVYYNLTVTGLSVAVAFVIGTVELVGVLHDDAGWSNPVTDWVSGIGLGNVGFVVVGLFVLTWVTAVAYWRFGRIEDRWAGDERGL